MKDMPLFYRFWTNTLVHRGKSDNMEHDREWQVGLQKWLRNCFLFSADDLAAAKFHVGKQGVEEWQDYGAVTTPYERMWLEYAIPQSQFDECSEFYNHVGRVGHVIGRAKCGEETIIELRNGYGIEWPVEAGSPNDYEWFMQVQDFVWTRNGLFIYVGTHFMLIHKDGIIGWCLCNKEAQLGGRCFEMLLMTLAMLNCKNVETVQVDVEGQKQKDAWHKRTRCPQVKFHTVRISGKGSHRSGPGHLSSGGDALLPWHSVRGHFARYTEDKPLFGKHVGQFWIPQHARGDAENGVVIKDYEVVP